MRAAGIALALAACSAPSPPAGSPEALAAYLQSIAASDPAGRRAEVAGWRLDRAGWERTVSPLYRPLYDDYAAAFATESPAIAAQLATGARVTARKHFAGDPRLTGAEARERWALPVLFPSLVAELGDAQGGAQIDAVFVADAGQWRALIGLDHALRARVAALDPACAAPLALAGPTGRCSEASAAVADAALRTDGAHRTPELDHVCRLAEALCGKGSP